MKLPVLLVVLIALIFAAPAGAQEPDSAYAYELSNYAIHGVATGVIWTTDGAYFDGINDYISLDCGRLALAGADPNQLFVAYSYMLDSESETGLNKTIIEYYADASNYVRSFQHPSAFYIYNQVNGYSVVSSTSTTPSTFISTNDYISNELSLWINNTYVDGETGASEYVGNPTACNFGRYQGANYFMGTVSDIIIGLGVIPDDTGRGLIHDALAADSVTTTLLDAVFGVDAWLYWPLRQVSSENILSLGTRDYITVGDSQLAAVHYEITAGDYAIALLMFLACLLLAVLVTVQVLNMRRTK